MSSVQIPLVLSGGSGTRLWPASRLHHPKQALTLTPDGTPLIHATVTRLCRAWNKESIAIVTIKNQEKLMQTLLPDLSPHQFITEPLARNTAAAIGLASLFIENKTPNATVAAIPADHYIAQEEAFVQTLQQGFALAQKQHTIVTIGIAPTHPATGYGYLKTKKLDDHSLAVERFIEKPDESTAQGYLASEQYLWNSGIFFFPVQHMLHCIKQHLPMLHDGLQTIQNKLKNEGEDAARQTIEKIYPQLPPLSIDHGVMEHRTDILALQGDFGWNDIGSWDAIASLHSPDKNNNVKLGNILATKANNNILISDKDHVIAAVGIDNIVVIQANNATLIIPRDKLQHTRDISRLLREQGLESFQ